MQAATLSIWRSPRKLRSWSGTTRPSSFFLWSFALRRFPFASSFSESRIPGGWSGVSMRWWRGSLLLPWSARSSCLLSVSLYTHGGIKVQANAGISLYLVAPSGVKSVRSALERGCRELLPLARLLYSFRPGLFFPADCGSVECSNDPKPQGCSLWSNGYWSTVCLSLPSG